MTTISPSDAAAAVAKGAYLLDVRTPGEYRAVHAIGANLLPLDQVQAGHTPEVRDEGQAIVILCKSGKRAEMAAAELSKGMKNPIHVVEGGTDAWTAAGFDYEKGQGVISLERQVRIAAGSLVLAGVILSFWVTAPFVWLSAFVGAGLIFAGVTDTCGMGMLLAKMPWNRG